MNYFVGLAPNKSPRPMLSDGGIDVEFSTMNLLRYCQPHFLSYLQTHFEEKGLSLQNEAGLSSAFMALQSWVKSLYYFSPDAFMNEQTLVKHLMFRQSGKKGMLELENVYSLSSLEGDNCVKMIVDVAKKLQKSYPIAPNQRDLVERLGTGNESANTWAFVTWIERELSKRIYKGESYRVEELIIPYWSVVAHRDEFEYV